MTPNGLADPVVLNKFLQNFCVSDNAGAQICDGYFTSPNKNSQIVNLWRLGAFAEGQITVSVEKPDSSAVRDLVSQGSPVLVALSVTTSGGSVSHYVVANGVNSDASIAILDPDPAYGRTNLNDYLNGFTASGVAVQGTLTGALRLLPRAPAMSGFLVSGSADFQLTSAAGVCGTVLKLDQLSAVFCDGSQNQYILESSSAASFFITLTDLALPGARSDLSGSGATAFAISHPRTVWTASPQALNFRRSMLQATLRLL